MRGGLWKETRRPTQRTISTDTYQEVYPSLLARFRGCKAHQFQNLERQSLNNQADAFLLPSYPALVVIYIGFRGGSKPR